MGTDVFAIAIIGICVAAVLIATLVVVILIVRFKKKKAAFDRARAKQAVTPAKKSDK